MTRISNIVLFAFIAASVSGCGGGGGSRSAAPTQTPNITANANCPVGVNKFTAQGTTFPNSNTFVQTNSIVLTFTTPATGALTVETCIVQSNDPNFPKAPAEVIALSGGSQTDAVVLADGQFDQLFNKKLSLGKVFAGFTNAQIDMNNIVSFTKNSQGVWQRTILTTTRTYDAPITGGTIVSQPVTFEAAITAPGYYAILTN
jgi:hypothetical protein